MSVFMLETSAVQSAADSLNSVASALEGLSDSINGYDTSQSGEDSFDFDGAKSVIAENVKAASIKVKNTQTLMTNVVDSHTKLQSSLKYGEEASDDSSKKNNSGNNSSGTRSSNGGYSPSGSYSGGYTSGGSTRGGSTAIATPTTPTRREEEQEETTKMVGIIPVAKDKYETDDSKKKEIATALTGVGLLAMSKGLTPEENILFERNYKIKYSKEGFAQVGDRYVIACDESYGDVGDMIDLKQKDGSYVKCVIGATVKNTDASKKDNISFITEDEITDKEITATAAAIKKNTTNVYNAGPDEEHKIAASNDSSQTTTEGTKTETTTATEGTTSTESTTTSEGTTNSGTTTQTTDTATSTEGTTSTESTTTSEGTTSSGTTTQTTDTTTSTESTTTDTAASTESATSTEATTTTESTTTDTASTSTSGETQVNVEQTDTTSTTEVDDTNDAPDDDDLEV